MAAFLEKNAALYVADAMKWLNDQCLLFEEKLNYAQLQEFSQHDCNQLALEFAAMLKARGLAATDCVWIRWVPGGQYEVLVDLDDVCASAARNAPIGYRPDMGCFRWK